ERAGSLRAMRGPAQDPAPFGPVAATRTPGDRIPRLKLPERRGEKQDRLEESGKRKRGRVGAGAVDGTRARRSGRARGLVTAKLDPRFQKGTAGRSEEGEGAMRPRRSRRRTGGS